MLNVINFELFILPVLLCL